MRLEKFSSEGQIEGGAGFKSLGDKWRTPPTAHGRLMLTILGGLAEFERELIRARTGKGRVRAKTGGVKFGRPPSLPPTNAKRPSSDSRGRDAGGCDASYGVRQATISPLDPALSAAPPA